MSQALDDFFQSHDWDQICRHKHWSIKQDDDLVIFELFARDDEKYRILLECTGYPDIAPSVVFVNKENSALDPQAWPKGNGEFFQVVKPPPNCFLCIPLTREGLKQHNHWAGQPSSWNSSSTLMVVLNYLDRLLFSSDYQGRGE